MNIQDVTAFITSATEADVAAIKNALDIRKQITALQLKASLVIGQTVYLTSGKPAYLNGAKAFVRKINRERIVIDLEKPMGKFHKNITCPISLLSTTPIK